VPRGQKDNANSTFFTSQNRARTIRRDAWAIDEQAYPDFYKKAYLSIWQHPILTSTRKILGIMAFWENSLWLQASGINLLACYVQRDIIITILRIIKFFGDKKDNDNIPITFPIMPSFAVPYITIYHV
jgi:hypothetical protein